jgi:BMFP domain-containing protein YqiC
MCDEKELLVGYVYDDMPDGDRVAFEAHLRGCADCRIEVKALRGVRGDLAVWAPPEPDFGFRVVRGGRNAAEHDVPRAIAPSVPSWRAYWTPAAGLAAAAVLVLAAASSIAHVEVHRGADGLTVRTGWSTAPAARSSEIAAGVAPAVHDTAAAAASPVDAAFVGAIERRLTALETANREVGGVRNASALSARASDAEVIRRVRELLAQSESKQQGELALRIAQVIRDVDAQRTADLAKIQKGLGQIGATVAEEAASHRDLTTYILASARQTK